MGFFDIFLIFPLIYSVAMRCYIYDIHKNNQWMFSERKSIYWENSRHYNTLYNKKRFFGEETKTIFKIWCFESEKILVCVISLHHIGFSLSDWLLLSLCLSVEVWTFHQRQEIVTSPADINTLHTTHNTPRIIYVYIWYNILLYILYFLRQ